jgi:hypothetical protein
VIESLLSENIENDLVNEKWQVLGLGLREADDLASLPQWT